MTTWDSSPTTRVSTSGSQDLGTITSSLAEAERVEAGRWQFWVRLRERRRQMLLTPRDIEAVDTRPRAVGIHLA